MILILLVVEVRSKKQDQRMVRGIPALNLRLKSLSWYASSVLRSDSS